MKALVFDGEVRLRERPEPAVAPGEVLLAPRVSGICATDLEIAKGYMGFRGTLGHEVVAEVVEGPPEWRGLRVVPEINAGCGACPVCAADGPNHCPTRTVLGIAGRDGALAERFVMPTRNLVGVPGAVPDELAVFTEPLAAALHSFDLPTLRPGADVLVLGDGKLGLLVAFALANQEAPLGRRVVFGRHPEKLAIAEGFGLEVSTDPARLGAFDVVVDATGHPSGLGLALERTRPRGTIVLKSTVAVGAEQNLAPVVIHELTIVGSRCGDFRRALALLARRGEALRPLIAGRYPLAEAERAFADAGARGTLKVLVEP